MNKLLDKIQQLTGPLALMIMLHSQYVSERLMLWFAKTLINPVLSTVMKSHTLNINYLPLLYFHTCLFETKVPLTVFFCCAQCES